MPRYTEYLNLFNYVPEDDGNRTFNIDSALSDNFDKIDAECGKIASRITNCILEAPNGVCSASGLTTTVYAGLKVLMPNGRNTDGTMKNIKYTVPSNFTNTQTSSARGGLYFIDQNNNIIGCHYVGFNVGLDADKPTTTWNPQGDNEVYYATDTNKFYVSINNGSL